MVVRLLANIGVRVVSGIDRRRCRTVARTWSANVSWAGQPGSGGVGFLARRDAAFALAVVEVLVV